ncbi:hypothetical protein BXT86_02160 [candidate division WOR-3 bacterium 4484_100]|uniref:VanZ-like domain-containing protein n=1 Tax=candidate division WOR-3 bacterium 4484_100 TaxID=1936077 RepID=A0A1V4QFY8_UNCW3|nr:MAG: hypothetical protein BXT86_02160 [candidate division WOR-3 bacterium 4484_100]
MTKSVRWVLLILWIGIIFVLTGYPKLSVPRIDKFPADKIYHFVAFFILGLCELRLFKWRDYFILGCSVALLAEFQQFFVPGRDVELFDILAGISGLLICYLIFRKRIGKEG